MLTTRKMWRYQSVVPLRRETLGTKITMEQAFCGFYGFCGFCGWWVRTSFPGWRPLLIIRGSGSQSSTVGQRTPGAGGGTGATYRLATRIRRCRKWKTRWRIRNRMSHLTEGMTKPRQPKADSEEVDTRSLFILYGDHVGQTDWLTNWQKYPLSPP